jgi:transitional endoplasmic reticulum ATPase
MPTAEVYALTASDVSFGDCYTNVSGILAGEPARITAGHNAAIYCRRVWHPELEGAFRGSSQIALDAWQRAALGVQDGDTVLVEGISEAEVPVADLVELRLTRWTGPRVDHSAGLPDFLRANRYLLYPGLRFGYQPLGGAGTGVYQVTLVKSGGQSVAVARVAGELVYNVRPDHGTGDWPPSYDEIAGLDSVVALLRREVELPLRRAKELAAVGVKPPAGVLLYGPPGTGKTMLARAVAHSSGARVTFVSGPELAGRPLSTCEGELRAAFAANEPDQVPGLVVIDDLDFLAPPRNRPGPTAPLLGLLQQLLDQPNRPIVLATTSKRDEIEPAIRRLGRIGRQIRVPAPSENDRKAILQVHTRWLPLALSPADQEEGAAPPHESTRSELLSELARKTAGFVGADLEALCHEAGCLALRRAFPLGVLESEEPEAQAPLQIERSDWDEALKLVTSSVIDSDVSDVPLTKFADVAGLPETVTTLRERLVYPVSRPEIFAAAGLHMERGVLLYGPPGTGKTLLARAVANECGCRFMAVSGSELLTKWFGESEQAVRDLFDRARAAAPCVVFFDEIDAIARRRSGGDQDGGASDRVVSTLLAEIDGLIDLGQVSIIGATNDKDKIDPALLRPGRLGLQIEVRLPDTAGRRELFAMYLPEALKGECGQWADQSPGLSGADIRMIAREAALNALRRAGFERPEPVRADDVTAALAARVSAMRQFAGSLRQ